MNAEPHRHQLVVIDDDPASRLICGMLARMVGNIDVIFFEDAMQGFNYVAHTTHSRGDHVVVLLDLNMPEMTGWEWLDKYDALAAPAKEQYSIYVLSSSVKEADRQRALLTNNVADYLLKPMSYPVMKDIIGTSPLATGHEMPDPA